MVWLLHCCSAIAQRTIAERITVAQRKAVAECVAVAEQECVAEEERTTEHHRTIAPGEIASESHRFDPHVVVETLTGESFVDAIAEQITLTVAHLIFIDQV